MSEIQTTGYCEYCKRQTMFVKPRINHVLHFFLGWPTLSLWWIFIWLPLGISNTMKPTRCTVCGMYDRQAKKVAAADEELAAIETARAADWSEKPAPDTRRSSERLL